MRIVVRNAADQPFTGPSGVLAQSNWRMSSRISPPPSRNENGEIGLSALALENFALGISAKKPCSDRPDCSSATTTHRSGGRAQRFYFFQISGKGQVIPKFW